MPREGSDIAKLVDTYLETVEATDFEERLSALEKADGQPRRVESELAMTAKLACFSPVTAGKK